MTKPAGFNGFTPATRSAPANTHCRCWPHRSHLLLQRIKHPACFTSRQRRREPRLTVSLLQAEYHPTRHQKTDRRLNHARYLAFFFNPAFFSSGTVADSSSQPISPPLRAEMISVDFFSPAWRNFRPVQRIQYRFRIIFRFGLNNAVTNTPG